MSIREFLRIRESKAKWNKVLEKYSTNISYETGTEITPRTVEVAHAFDLGIDQTKKFVLHDKVQLEINKDDIVFITGDRESRKSVCMHALQTTRKILVKTLLLYTQDYYHKLKIIEGTVVVSESIPTRGII